MVIVWDETKRATNLRVHGVDFADIRDGFDFTAADIAGTYAGRFRATGYLGDELVTVIFAPLGEEAISVVSARIASRKERRVYGDR